MKVITFFVFVFLFVLFCFCFVLFFLLLFPGFDDRWGLFLLTFNPNLPGPF